MNIKGNALKRLPQRMSEVVEAFDTNMKLVKTLLVRSQTMKKVSDLLSSIYIHLYDFMKPELQIHLHASDEAHDIDPVENSSLIFENNKEKNI